MANAVFRGTGEGWHPGPQEPTLLAPFTGDPQAQRPPPQGPQLHTLQGQQLIKAFGGGWAP